MLGQELAFRTEKVRMVYLIAHPYFGFAADVMREDMRLARAK